MQRKKLIAAHYSSPTAASLRALQLSTLYAVHTVAGKRAAACSCSRRCCRCLDGQLYVRHSACNGWLSINHRSFAMSNKQGTIGGTIPLGFAATAIKCQFGERIGRSHALLLARSFPPAVADTVFGDMAMPCCTQAAPHTYQKPISSTCPLHNLQLCLVCHRARRYRLRWPCAISGALFGLRVGDSATYDNSITQFCLALR